MFRDEWETMTCLDCGGKGSCPFCSSTGKVYKRKEKVKKEGLVKIKNENDLFSHFCAESVGQLKKAVFKYTSCGAWVEVFPAHETWDEKLVEAGVSFGSIVEGVDETTQTYTVTFPCNSDEIDNALNSVEEEAREIWNKTHGCAYCWNEETVVDEWGNEAGPEDYGMRPVDENCPECKGRGIII